ncbi:hypothetical protein GCM10010985_18620 [Caballeronia grimmiae]|uniref:Stress-induced protein n=1 Tax=Caballeronia grimmiae TaxID=1071679 RepID=A0ABQ1RBC9_9BURK|nr:hypothetical protein GCM10010985_18620 [Caballeronia grimmiae]
MHERSGGFGRGGVEKVGADRRRRMDAEQQDEERRHQRTAAYARQSDEETDREPGGGIEEIDMRKGHRAEEDPSGKVESKNRR